MMIKLFLITLLCATLVLADSPVEQFEDAWKSPVNGLLGIADHFMGRGSSLVRRSAQGGPGGPGRPPGSPPGPPPPGEMGAEMETKTEGS